MNVKKSRINGSTGKYSPYKSLDEFDDIIKDEVDLTTLADQLPHQDVSNNRLASLLRQKQRDQREKQELRFKLEKTIAHNEVLQNQNQQLKSKLSDTQQKYLNLEHDILSIILPEQTAKYVKGGVIEELQKFA